MATTKTPKRAVPRSKSRKAAAASAAAPVPAVVPIAPRLPPGKLPEPGKKYKALAMPRFTVLDSAGNTTQTEYREIAVPESLAESVKTVANGIVEFARDVRNPRDPDSEKDARDVEGLHEWIVDTTTALSFDSFHELLKAIPAGYVNENGDSAKQVQKQLANPAYGLDSYRHLRRLALWFVRNKAVPPSKVDPRKLKQAEAAYDASLITFKAAYAAYLKEATGEAPLPYYEVVSKRVLRDPEDIVVDRLANPLPLELIWAYWMEEGLLAQTMNAISLRFQNRRVRPTPGPDPLFRFDISPLSKVSNLLWSFIEWEPHRTSVKRRAYEYNHAYGLTLHGRAVSAMEASDPRSTFLGAFHGLLHRCIQFFKQEDDRMVRADAFPVLNGLREIHLVLGEGNHNQVGELVVASRVEMIVQQWILALPEIGVFLGGRPMTPYPQLWMDRVDTTKGLLGIVGPSIIHFHDLATSGERILLLVRNGPWGGNRGTRGGAKAFARALRGEIQKYVHAYQAVTGVDLTAGPSAELPSKLIQRRFAAATAR